MDVQTNKHMNAADVVDIPNAAIITVALRQIITCFPALGGGWSDELIVCVCLCAFVSTDISGAWSTVLKVLLANGIYYLGWVWL